MLLQEMGRYCHLRLDRPVLFCFLIQFLSEISVRRMRSRMMQSCVLRGIGGLPSTSVWGYVDSHKHCLPLSLPLLSSFVSFFLIIIEQPPDGGCKRYHFLIALPRAMRRSSCSLGRDFMISINSAAFVGFVDSISKKSFGVIPK